MNYLKIYYDLVGQAKSRGLDKSQYPDTYHEIHHIQPRCMGGNDDSDNLVMFTAREHFVAHLLLWKIYPENVGIVYAAQMMSMLTTSEYKVTSRIFESLKLARASKVLDKYDLTGQVFGRLSVVKLDKDATTKYFRWLCQCSCGNPDLVSIAAPELRRGACKSCGCLMLELRSERMSVPRLDLTGQVFGNLSVQSMNPDRKEISGVSHYQWNCECVCGNTKIVPTARLRSGNVTSCGCLKNQHRKNMMANMFKGVKPWETLNSQKDIHQQKWAMADYYHTLWTETDSLKSVRFTKLYNELHNDDQPKGFFDSMVKMFCDGWIPEKDTKWKTFNLEYFS